MQDYHCRVFLKISPKGPDADCGRRSNTEQAHPMTLQSVSAEPSASASQHLKNNTKRKQALEGKQQGEKNEATVILIC